MIRSDGLYHYELSYQSLQEAYTNIQIQEVVCMTVGFLYEAIFNLNKHKCTHGSQHGPSLLNSNNAVYFELSINYSTPHYYTNHTDIFIAIVL